MTTAPQSNASSREVNPSEAANRNHEVLFPNHKSTLQITDPELIQVFDNFAFDEVLAESQLDTRTRVVMILAVLIGRKRDLRPEWHLLKR